MMSSSASAPTNGVGHKQLAMLLKLTESLSSNDAPKRSKRENLCRRLTRSILNNPKFPSFLELPSSLSIEERLHSVHCKLCHRALLLLQHREPAIYRFAQSLLRRLSESNEALTELVMVSVFTLYPGMTPPALITMTNDGDGGDDADILGKLRAMTAMMDCVRTVFGRRNDFKMQHQRSLSLFELQFNLMVFSMYRVPPHSAATIDPQRPWSVEPYKLPTLEVQCELIRFWLNTHSLSLSIFHTEPMATCFRV